MPPDPNVFRALETVLATDPSNMVVRIHLAGLLLSGDRPAEALRHLEIALAARPDHLQALRLAARAAISIGDNGRAEAWKRLADALDSADGEGVAGHPTALDSEPSDTVDSVDPVAGVPVRDASLRDSADWDAELVELLSYEQADRVTLADVAGLDQVKQQLDAGFLAPMRNPDLRKRYGASMRGGLLLWGPPGCGKTFLARAVAGELGAHFVSVGLHDVLDMWLGNSEKKLHEVFVLARKRRPTVLFFDEIDAIGHARTDLGRSAGRNVVAQLLAEMDGVDTTNDGIFIIGATNQLWDVDPALLRPGRLDRNVLILPPDAGAREAVLEYHLRGRPWSGEALARIASSTEGFSGADLRLVCDEASQRALSDAVRSGSARPIDEADLMAVVQRTRPSTRPWLEMARNFATYANATGEYDELAAYLRSQRRVR
jgi:AAA+ superfamily predicted ATPase